jgi:outer membrane protein OmpA-like peptidoglycan-associated protein
LKTDPRAPASEPGTGTREGDKSSDDSDSDESDDPPDSKGEKNTGACRQSKVGLTLTIDKKAVNLEEGRVQARMDGPICSLVMRLWRKDGTVVEKQFHYDGPEQELRWAPVPRDQIEKVEFRITAKDNAYRAVTLTPWSVNIDHKEVKFDTNKALIRASEVASLEDSFEKIKEVLAKVQGKDLGPITLFIAGHTDTRGSNEHNMTLSRERAQSIAAWFQKQGLCIPIAFEGFGESALKKLTADEVDEQANRRVDYILAVEPPVIKKGAVPAWRLVSKGCSSPAR